MARAWKATQSRRLEEAISCNPVAPDAIPYVQTVWRGVHEGFYVRVFRKELLIDHRLMSRSVSEVARYVITSR